MGLIHTVHNIDQTSSVSGQNYQKSFLMGYTGQQNLTFFFVPRGKISNPDSTFIAEFKYVSRFSPLPTVFFVTAKLNAQYWSATLYDSAECLVP
jgi:hypothetical protein